MRKQEAMVLRNTEILCGIGLEMGDANMEELLDVMHLVFFDMNLFKSALSRERECKA